MTNEKFKIITGENSVYYMEGRIFMEYSDGTVLEWVPKEKIDSDYFNAILNDNGLRRCHNTEETN